MNEWGVREQCGNLFRELSVWSGIGASGQDNWQVEELRDACMCKNVVPELIRREVANQLEETILVVHYKKKSFALIKSSESLIARYSRPKVRILRELLRKRQKMRYHTSLNSHDRSHQSKSRGKGGEELHIEWREVN